MRHLIDGVGAPVAVPAGEFADIAVQMLHAHMMVGAVIAALEQRPKRLDPVCVRLAVHILSNAVAHACMVKGNAPVGRCTVCVNSGV